MSPNFAVECEPARISNDAYLKRNRWRVYSPGMAPPQAACRDRLRTCIVLMLFRKFVRIFVMPPVTSMSG